MDVKLDASLVTALANAIQNQSILLNWKFYVLFIVIMFVVTCGSSYLISYFTTKGKNYATKDDFERILNELRETTKTAEEIKSSISHTDWAIKEYKLLKRNKLEELLLAIYTAEDWVDKYFDFKLDANKESVERSPIYKVRLIATLYFSEWSSELSALQSAHANCVICLNECALKLMPIKHEVAKASLESEHAFKTSNADGFQAAIDKIEQLTADNSAVLKLYKAPILESRTELRKAIISLEAKASLYMKELTENSSESAYI